jgi:hypothetical protein
MDLNKEVFELFDSGKTAGQIARKLKVKKAVVTEILGGADDKGLGDKIEKFTEATGIKAVVEAITDDCGCAARKESLNKLFPNRKLNDLSIESYEWLKGWYSQPRYSVKPTEQAKLVEIYNEVFNSKRVVSNCSPCIAAVNRELKSIYEAAEITE